jgi:hypothetical protein
MFIDRKNSREAVIYKYNALKRIAIIVYMIHKCTHNVCMGWHQKKHMCAPFDTTTFILIILAPIVKTTVPSLWLE